MYISDRFSAISPRFAYLHTREALKPFTALSALNQLDEDVHQWEEYSQ